MKQNSRNYAKRQMTWFRHQARVSWFVTEREAGQAVGEWLKAVAHNVRDV